MIEGPPNRPTSRHDSQNKFYMKGSPNKTNRQIFDQIT